MKNINRSVAIVVMTLIVASCAKLPVYQSKNINSTDEISDQSHYDKKSKISYDVYNDETNIYININTSNYYSQIKILKMGLTVWFDIKGKKNKDMGIVFPLNNGFKASKQRMQNSSGATGAGGQSITQLHNNFKLQDKRIRLVGMEDEHGRTEYTVEPGSSDVVAEITFDSSNRLNYVATIPIKKLFADGSLVNKTLSVGIESGFLDVNKMRQEMMNSGMHQGQGGRGGGMGGMGGGMKGGGGRQGGGRSGGMPQQTELSEPVKVWFAVDLNSF